MGQHPALDAYLRGASLYEYFRVHPDAPDSISRALRDLLRPSMDAREAEGCLRDVRDPIQILFLLIIWANRCALDGRIEELSALLNRAEGFLGSSTPKELRSILVELRASLVRARGNAARAAEISRESLKTLPPNTPFYAKQVINVAITLARLGREPEVEPELDSLDEDLAWTVAPGRSYARLIQAVESCRWDDARRHLADLRRSPDYAAMVATPLAEFSSLLEYARTGAASTADEKILERLAGHSPVSALEIARREASERPDRYLAAGLLPSFNLIRAELAAGNGSSARRLLQLRHERGNEHWLDDFFLARADGLAGHRDSAASRLAGVLRAAERYDSLPRIDAELRWACEIRPTDLLRLGSISRPPAPAPRPAPAPIPLLGSSRSMAAVREAVERFAPLDAIVLITGETGTGKELVARALHRSGPWVAINCGAIAESLLESELFGFERGAFTGAQRSHRGLFEQAGGGTLLLDEIGEISPRLQAALLRVLESGEVRPIGSTRSRRITCRILASTNRDLEALSKEGRFRKDLLFRLRRLEIVLPPLRRRPEDIDEIADYYLNQGRDAGRAAALTPEARAMLRNYPWPGNVRELRSEIERMRMVNSDPLAYGVEHLSERLRQPSTAEPALEPALDERSWLRRLDRLKSLFELHRKLTRKEISRFLRISDKTATLDLEALIGVRFIERIKPTPSPRTWYFAIRSTSGGEEESDSPRRRR